MGRRVVDMQRPLRGNSPERLQAPQTYIVCTQDVPQSIMAEEVPACLQASAKPFCLFFSEDPFISQVGLPDPVLFRSVPLAESTFTPWHETNV